MLQVARLAPTQLDEAVPLVVDYLHSQVHEDGGARDRSGKSDLYYTAFLLEDFFALGAEPPREKVSEYLSAFGNGEQLDSVHRACLVRCWAALGTSWPSAEFSTDILTGVEALRSADGGYAANEGAQDGTLYHAFLTLGVYQDLGASLPEAERLSASIVRLRSRDGGYANALDLPMGTTPSTAAAAALLRNLGQPTPDPIGPWLKARVHPSGGFLAMPEAPIPDLLSTATALHALSGLDISLEPLREACLDFIDTLWTGRSFVGHWDDDVSDCEYLFYALLALGHLSV
ncbi:MAG: hypothetical protein ACI8QZ_000316 [Chlamydiales bacterium]|jgi:hypothetical protein